MSIALTTTGNSHVEIDDVSEREWDEAVATFRDANIYQTWAYEACAHPRSGVSRLTLRRDGQLVAIAQARLVVLPAVRRGFALVRWGPLWRRGNEPADPAHLREALGALVQEYAVRRKLAVQVLPAPSACDTAAIESALANAGFRRRNGTVPGKTIVVDLRKDLVQLQAGLHKKWRNCLSYARRSAQEVVEGDSDELFAQFSVLYRQMRARKRFQSSTSVDAFRALQQRLAAGQKMRVFICRTGSGPCAGAVVSLLGDTGVWLFGASDGAGLEKKSSYLVQWKVLEWLKRNRATAYDLNGVNQTSNPGGYCFKSRLAGANGQETVSLGPFLATGSPLSTLLTEAGTRCLGSLRDVRHRAADVWRSRTARGGSAAGGGETGQLE